MRGLRTLGPTCLTMPMISRPKVTPTRVSAGGGLPPSYDRSRLRRAGVHFGVGMCRTELGEVFDAQDNLFTVVQRGA